VHAATIVKLRAFRDVYAPAGGRVLDVGSWSTGTISARDLFADDRYSYIGLDLQSGTNVDLVPADPYKWDELDRESFDFVVSSSTYEHNPYFWLTTAEIARVLKIGGYACIVTPSSGGVHRYPLDCWRLYPDATAALAGYVGLEAVESYTERPRFRKVTFGQRWRDHMSILHKPDMADPEAFYAHLEAITLTRMPNPGPAQQDGPAIELYERMSDSSVANATRIRSALLWHRLTHKGRPANLW
jgi:SAM-dependent methyltransferase